MSNSRLPKFPEVIILDVENPETQIIEYEEGLKELNNIIDLNNKINKNKEEQSLKKIISSIIISSTIIEKKEYCKKCNIEIDKSKNNIEVNNNDDSNNEKDKEILEPFNPQNIINAFIMSSQLSERKDYCEKCCEEVFGTKEHHILKINKIIEDNNYNYKDKNLEI